MSAGNVQCTLNAIGECGLKPTALPGDVVRFELFLQNNSAEDCEYGVEVQAPITLPLDATSDPIYTPFNGASGTVDDCIVLPCGACMSIVWEVTVPEDSYCSALTFCVRLTKKTDEVETVIKKNLKTGVAQVTIPVKPEVKALTSQTIAIGVNAEDLKSCPDSNGRRSNDGEAVKQWISGAWDDCTAAAMADACDAGYSFIEFIKSCISGEPLELPELVITLDKNDIAEAIQGKDLDEDGDTGGVTVTPGSGGEAKTKAPTDPNAPAPEISLENEGKERLKELAREAGLAVSGTRGQLIERLQGAQ